MAKTIRVVKKSANQIAAEQEASDYLQRVLDVALIRYHDDHADETFLECRLCGEWEDHAPDCVIPAIVKWLDGGTK